MLWGHAVTVCMQWSTMKLCFDCYECALFMAMPGVLFAIAKNSGEQILR
jgi:hypothetical protein